MKENNIRKMYLFHIQNDSRTQFFSLVANEKCFIFVLAPSRNNMLPNISKMWQKYLEELKEETEDHKLLPLNIKFEEVRVETQHEAINKAIGRGIYLFGIAALGSKA